MIKKIIDVIAIIGNVFGAIFVAGFGSNPNMAILGYMFFIIGSCAAIYLLKHSDASKSLLYINWFFLVINVVGILTRLPVVIS